MGIEPTTTSLPRRCSTTEPPRHTQSLTLKSGRRESNPRGQLGRLEHYHCATPAQNMGADGFEPSQGESPTDLQSVAIGRSATPPYFKKRKKTLSLSESASIVYKNIKKVNINIYDKFFK